MGDYRMFDVSRMWLSCAPPPGWLDKHGLRRLTVRDRLWWSRTVEMAGLAALWSVGVLGALRIAGADVGWGTAGLVVAAGLFTSGCAVGETRAERDLRRWPRSSAVPPFMSPPSRSR